MERTMHAWRIEDREYRRQESRRGRRHAFTSLVPERTALVVVDMVPFFAEEFGYVRGIVPNIARLAAELRAAGGTVAWVLPGAGEPSALAEDFFGPGFAEAFRTSGGEGPLRSRLWHEFEVHDADLVLEKFAASAFFPGKSPLPGLLEERGVDTVLITGTVTNVCCESSARDARTIGYRVIMVADANAARRDEDHNAALYTIYRTFGDVRTTDEVISLIRAPMTAFEVVGELDAPPLVLLHGLGGDGRDWQPVLPALAEKHRVHVLDLRGHGRSPHPGHYSFELMRDDVLAYLDAAGLERCALAGHSMGGVVAMLVAQAAPDRLSHLVLEDAPILRPGDLERPPLPPPDEPTPFDFAAVNAIRAQLHDPDPAGWENSSSVSVPTLIIGGGPDSQIPQHLHAELRDHMPAATLVTIAAGHHVHRDQPAEFVAAVDAFLTNYPRSTEG